MSKCDQPALGVDDATLSVRTADFAASASALKTPYLHFCWTAVLVLPKMRPMAAASVNFISNMILRHSSSSLHHIFVLFGSGSKPLVVSIEDIDATSLT